MKLIQRAKKLRKEATDAEKKIWSIIRNRQIIDCKFKRQVPLGDYIVDFICLERKLIIEVDGGQHQEQKEYDQKRTNWLNSRGYKVLRFWNNIVLSDIETVKNKIYLELESTPHPNPLPQGERGLEEN